MKLEITLTCSTTLLRKSSHRFLPSSVACSNTPVADEPVLSSDSQTSLIQDQRISSAVVKHFNRSLKDKSIRQIALYKISFIFSLTKIRRCSCLMVSVLTSRSRFQVQCVFGQDSRFSQCFSPPKYKWVLFSLCFEKCHWTLHEDPRFFATTPLQQNYGYLGQIIQTAGLHLKDNQIIN